MLCFNKYKSNLKTLSEKNSMHEMSAVILLSAPVVCNVTADIEE